MNLLLIDVAKTYKITSESLNQVTELAYIIYERMKCEEHENSLALLFSEHLRNDQKGSDIIIYLLYALLQFDHCLLAKLLLQTLKQKKSLQWAPALIQLLNQNKT